MANRSYGLRYAMNWFNERYEKPLFIVENGFGAIDEIGESGKSKMIIALSIYESTLSQ